MLIYIILLIIGGIVIYAISAKITSTKTEKREREFIANGIVSDSYWFVEYPETRRCLQLVSEQLKTLGYIHVDTIREKIRKEYPKPDIKKQMLELCYQIEKCGASEELTKASVMASDILHGINPELPPKEERNLQNLRDRFASAWKRWLDFQGHREYWDVEALRDEPFEKTLERCEEIVGSKKTGQPTLDNEYYFRVLKAKAIKEGIIKE